MCLGTFTENVITLAVESCLVRELEHIFTPDMVRRMKYDDLNKLDTRSEARAITERTQLRDEIRKLKDSLNVCRKHMSEGIPSEAPPAAGIRVIGISTKRNDTPSAHDAPQTKALDGNDTDNPLWVQTADGSSSSDRAGTSPPTENLSFSFRDASLTEIARDGSLFGAASSTENTGEARSSRLFTGLLSADTTMRARPSNPFGDNSSTENERDGSLFSASSSTEKTGEARSSGLFTGLLSADTFKGARPSNLFRDNSSTENATGGSLLGGASSAETARSGSAFGASSSGNLLTGLSPADKTRGARPSNPIRDDFFSASVFSRPFTSISSADATEGARPGRSLFGTSTENARMPSNLFSSASADNQKDAESSGQVTPMPADRTKEPKQSEVSGNGGPSDSSPSIPSSSKKSKPVLSMSYSLSKGESDSDELFWSARESD